MIKNARNFSNLPLLLVEGMKKNSYTIYISFVILLFIHVPPFLQSSSSASQRKNKQTLLHIVDKRTISVFGHTRMGIRQ